MKYRRLTTEELAELETEFIRFLVSNTVTGDDWEKIKKEDPKKAVGLIEIFSDIVFDKTISKIEYLEMKTPKDLKIFRCNKDDIELMGLKIEGESDLDLTADISSEEMMVKLQSSDAKLQLYSANKKYKNENREQELFQMMQWGSLISDGKLFHLLRTLKK
jgi:hypothetical protein